MTLDMPLSTYVAVAASFAAGGFVKGLLAFGLPLVMVPALSMVFPLPEAVALALLPILVANIWQIVLSGGIVDTLKRHWTVMLSLVVCLAISVHLLVELDEKVVLLIAGTVVLTFVAIDLFGLKLAIPPHHERLVGVIAGAVGGTIGGMTSFFGTPPLMYLHALHMPKDRFVQSTSVVLLSGGVTLTVMLAKLSVLGPTELTLSTAGMVPMIAGLMIGQKLRAKIDQALFRRLVLIGLLFVGLSMVARADVYDLVRHLIHTAQTIPPTATNPGSRP